MFSFFLNGKKNAPGLAGIDLREDGVSMVHVVRQPGRLPVVEACDFRRWDSGTSREAVMTRLAVDHGLKHVRCSTVLDPNDYSLLLTEAPDVPADELRYAVRWRIKDLIDFHVDDATIDVFDISTPAVSGKARSMYVVAARNLAIQQRVDLCDTAGINLDIIDIAEMAQRNIAAALPEDVRGVVTLSFTSTQGLITVTRQGEIYLSRRFDIGSEAFNGAVDSTATFDYIVLEIQRSLDYFDSHFRQGQIEHLRLVSPGTEIAGLIDHLNQNLNLKAEIIDLAQSLQYKETHAAALRSHSLTALGAALRQETQTL